MLRLKRERNSPYWYVRGTVKGLRIYESTGTVDRKDAEEYRVKREREAYQTQALGHRKPATWSDAVIAYRDAGRSPRYLLPLLDLWGELPLPSITQTVVDAAARRLYPGRSPWTTIRQVYTPVSAVLNYAAKIGMEGAAFSRLQKPRAVRKAVRWATDDYLDKLIPCCAPGVAAAVMVMTNTGLRTGEVIRLTPEAFTIKPGWVLVDVTKNGEPAFAPLTPETHAAVLAVLPAEGPAFRYETTQGFGKALKKAAEIAGVPYMRGHAIGRHAFAARMLAAGYDIKTLKEAGRWKKLAVVDETYGHLEGRQVHDAMRKAARK